MIKVVPGKVKHNGEQESDTELHSKGYAPGSAPPTAANTDYNIHVKPPSSGIFVPPTRYGGQSGKEFQLFSGSIIPPGFPKNGWCSMFL